MNKFFNAELAKAVKEITKFDELVARVDKNPSVMYTLSLDELKKLNCYYEEIIRRNQSKILELEASSPPSDQ